MLKHNHLRSEGVPYIPAASYDWLTPTYDLFIRLTMPERTFKQCLIKQASIQADHRILDLGCGTATLTLMMKQTHRTADVIGLDGDPKILKIARSKAQKAGLEISFIEGMAFALPYPDSSFDRVLSSLVFHHLTRENKVRATAEAFRVLKPGGEFHIADWGNPHNPFMRVASLMLRTFHHHGATLDNLQGLLPQLILGAGFKEVKEEARFGTLFGTLALYRALKPASMIASQTD